MSDKFLNSTGLTALRNWIVQKLGLKQDTLVSGTNIKTINSQSILGSGNLTVSGGLQNLVDGSSIGSLTGIGALPTTLDYSTALGFATIINNYYQLVTGIWNTDEMSSNNLFIIGNGTSRNNRSNAFTVDFEGNTMMQGRATTADMTAEEITTFINELRGVAS